MLTFRKLAFMLVSVVLLTGAIAATQVLKTNERLTVDATVGGVGLAALTISPAAWANSNAPDVTYCRGVLETGAIRWLANGTAPTATTGEPLEVGATIELFGTATIRAWRGIRQTATSGVIDWQCGR
jgi:hypothetical protein